MSDLSPTEASTGQTDADYIAPKDATPAPCVAKQPKADNALNKTETVPGAPQYDNPLVGFPASQPEAPPFDHGWFLQTHINVFSALITEDTKVIAEIGSWYGASTKWLAETATNAMVYAIDLWDDQFILNDNHYHMKNNKLSTTLGQHPLYQTFLRNMWALRHKVVPIHMDSVAGLEWLKAQNIEPDIIYIDGDHHYEAVVRDLEACSRLFPDAILVGDDYGNYKDVERAVTECAARRMKSVHVDMNHCWTYTPLVSKTGQTYRPSLPKKPPISSLLQKYKDLKRKPVARATPVASGSNSTTDSRQKPGMDL